MGSPMKHLRGFTLLEVLVALAIFATVAASLLGATASSLRTAARLEEKTLAGWIADNQLVELQLQRPSPDIGRTQRDLSYAGRDWQLQADIHSTSDVSLRRVTLWVAPRDLHGSSELTTRASLVVNGFIGVRE
jgi:general secretion pathway protein I